MALSEVAASSVRFQAGNAETKGVALEIENTDPVLLVQADQEGVRQILDNLIDNAIKYTSSGGKVSIRWTAEGGMAKIEVQDTGIGIPKDVQHRLFERFYRVDKARSRELGGTGLGLSIVKHLAQFFNGSVEVESEPGQGSTFTVRLPLA